jgi:hypothetical protein
LVSLASEQRHAHTVMSLLHSRSRDAIRVADSGGQKMIMTPDTLGALQAV